mgnify:FL=1
MESKIVMYSLLQPDSTIKAFLSFSRTLFGNTSPQQQITNAVVKLYRDGEFIETLTYVPPSVQTWYPEPTPFSEYVSAGETKPLPGSVYRIVAEIPGFKTAAGSASLPGIVPIEGIDTVSYTRDEFYMYLGIKTRFTDPAGKDNFYMISGYQKTGYYSGNPYQPWNPEIPVRVFEYEMDINADDEPLIYPFMNDDIFNIYPYNYFNVFSDEMIPGKGYELNLKTDYRKVDTTYYEFFHPTVILQSISEDLYLYLLSFSKYLDSYDDFFSEPVLVYTNVENGLGVVGAINSSKMTVEIGKYPVDGILYSYGD